MLTVIGPLLYLPGRATPPIWTVSDRGRRLLLCVALTRRIRRGNRAKDRIRVQRIAAPWRLSAHPADACAGGLALAADMGSASDHRAWPVGRRAADLRRAPLLASRGEQRTARRP